MYYIVAVPVILTLFYIEKISKRYIVIFFLVVSVCTIGIGKINNKMIGNSNYTIVTTVLPLIDLVRNADSAKDSEDLQNLSKVIDLDVIYNDTTLNGEILYWTGLRKDYSEEDYHLYFKSYISMVKKYPDILFKSLMKNFLESAGVIIEDGYTKQTSNASFGDLIYTGRRGEAWAEIRAPFKQPINMNLRNEVKKILAGIDGMGRVTPIYFFAWNLLIPLFLICICLLYKIYKRDWFMVLIILTVLARVPIVFFTSSISYLMYYLSVYLLSYFLSFLIIAKMIFEFRNKGYVKLNRISSIE